MKTCPKCNNEHEKLGKFCSRKCANSRFWTKEDKDKKSKSAKQFYETNHNANLGKSGWKHSNEDKLLKRKKTLEFWDNKGRLPKEHFIITNRIYVSNYRARKLNATPTNADMKLIGEIYKMCPDNYEVDHIIALAEGGLHHQDNLQYLPAMENRRKNKTQNYDRKLAVSWKQYIPQNPSTVQGLDC